MPAVASQRAAFYPLPVASTDNAASSAIDQGPDRLGALKLSLAPNDDAPA